MTAFHRLFGLLVFTTTALYSQPYLISSHAGGEVGDGNPATSAWLYSVTSLAIDSQGDLYIADPANHRIRKVDKVTGLISTVAGTGLSGFSGDNGQATQARLYYPSGVDVDGAGNLYISDTENHRIRKVNKMTGVITTIAGTGTAGYSGDGGSALSATLHSPNGLAVNASGTALYFADTANNVVRLIANGQIDRVAGSPSGLAGENTSSVALSSLLSRPLDVAMGPLSGGIVIYIADTGNQKVRRVMGTTITVVAGGGTVTADGGLATAALIATPVSVDATSTGDLYIADQSARSIRVVSTAGVIGTVAHPCGGT